MKILLLCMLLSTRAVAADLRVGPGGEATLAAAVAKLPAKIDADVTIRVSGKIDGPPGTLELNRPMREGVVVRIVGDEAVLNWTAPDKPLVMVTQGRWS